MKPLNFGLLWLLFFGSSIVFFLFIFDNFPDEIIWGIVRNNYPNEISEDTEDAIFMGYVLTMTLLANAAFIFLTLTISQKTSRLRMGITSKKFTGLWTVFALTFMAFSAVIHDCVPKSWMGIPPIDPLTPRDPAIASAENNKHVDTVLLITLMINFIFMIITLHIANRLRSSRLKKGASSADAHH